MEIYRRIDELLALRARDYPRRVEPTFGSLQAAIRELAVTLRARVGAVAPEEARLAATPVFVVGYYRSGTTLMLNLLGGHPDVLALPGESKHFVATPADEPLAELHAGWIRRLVSPDGLPPFWSLGRPWEDGGDDLYEAFTRKLLAFVPAQPPDADVLAAVAAAIAAARGTTPRLWVEKTPRNELLVPMILRAYPSARFVHMVRDPRTTVASVRDFNRGRHLASIPVAAVEVGGSLAAADENAERIGADRYCLVRYEDLVEEPRREMERVAEFLDLPWSEALVTPSTTANSSVAARRVQGRIERRPAAEDARLARVPDAIVRAFAAEAARPFGYEMASGSSLVATATRAYLSVALRSRRALARARGRARRRSRSS